jgi:hypothetical protein
MSGLDETGELWIIEYLEYCFEDYISSFRGVIAKNKDDAIDKGKTLIKYFNLEYNCSDDVNNPDYKFQKVFNFGEKSIFRIQEKQLERMKKRILEAEGEGITCLV